MRTVIPLLLLMPVLALANGEWMPTDPFTDYPLEALNRENIEEAIEAVMPFDFITLTATEVGGYVGDDLAHGYQTLFYTFDDTGRLNKIRFLYILANTNQTAINNLIEVADHYKPLAMSVGISVATSSWLPIRREVPSFVKGLRNVIRIGRRGSFASTAGPEVRC